MPLAVSNLTMLVATHKQAPMPADGFYLPVHVGHALNPVHLGFQVDDDGENISTRNASYCELTALYWAWKNASYDGVGLSHYRRYFKGTQPGPNGSKILSLHEAIELLEEYDVVLGKPRNYVVETIDSHYRNGHHGDDLDVLYSVIKTSYPDFLPAYEEVFEGRKLSLYNMFVMRGECFNEYANWLFGVLDQVEARIDNESRTAYQKRTFGYLGERLLNVWVASKRNELRIGTRRIINSEGEPKVKKAMGMVRRKFTGRATQ